MDPLAISFALTPRGKNNPEGDFGILHHSRNLSKILKWLKILKKADLRGIIWKRQIRF